MTLAHGFTVWGNQIEGTIPSELGHLPELGDSFLRDNIFTGPIPTELGNVNASEIVAKTNRISGWAGGMFICCVPADPPLHARSVPTQLGRWSNLAYLTLEQNWLSGSLPTQLGGMLDINSWYLSTNYLTSELPTQVGRLTATKR